MSIKLALSLFNHRNKAMKYQITHIDAKLIYGDPGQPRKSFDTEGLKELADSIKTVGLIQPITVRQDAEGRFPITAGERRFRAISQYLNWTTIPCLLAEMDDNTSKLQALIENTNRRDLTPNEECDYFHILMTERKCTAGELAKLLGLSQWRVKKRLQLRNLDKRYRSIINSNGSGLNNTQAYEMSRLPIDQQEVMFQLIANGKVVTPAQCKETVSKILTRVENKKRAEKGEKPIGTQDALFNLEQAYKPSKKEKEVLKDFHLAIERAEKAIALGFDKTQMGATLAVLKKVAPEQLASLEKRIVSMKAGLSLIEKETARGLSRT